MITIIIPIFSLNLQNEYKEEEETSKVRKQLEELYKPAIDFYKKYIGIKEIDFEYFLEINEFKVEINFGLIKNHQEIMNHLNKASIPLIRFSIEKNILSYTDRLQKDNVKIISLTEGLGGYTLLIKDPFNNIIQIECDTFEDDHIKDVSNWPFYQRL